MAGVPLLTVVAHRAAAQAGTAIVAQHAHLATDPVLDHIIRQLAAAHNAMRRESRGEPLRALAAQLRTLAVYSRDIDLDARVASSIDVLIGREGREALVNAQPDRTRLRAELEQYGAIPDDRILNAPISLSVEQRSEALDRIRRSGLSGSWERLATVCEQVAADFDRRAGAIVRVSTRQDADYWEGFCTELWNQFSDAQFIAAAICGIAALPLIGAPAMPLCVAHQLGALTLGYVYAAYCYNR